MFLIYCFQIQVWIELTIQEFIEKMPIACSWKKKLQREGKKYWNNSC